MSEISESIQDKCLAFSDRIIKLNDYLLEQAASRMSDGRSEKAEVLGRGSHLPSRIPVHLKSVAALSNQLLRSGTSIGANNAEACNAISRQDFRAKSYIALKEARESLYWIELLHRNNYLDDKQYKSLNADCEELVKILVHRCKKLDEHPPSTLSHPPSTLSLLTSSLSPLTSSISPLTSSINLQPSHLLHQPSHIFHQPSALIHPPSALSPLSPLTANP